MDTIVGTRLGPYLVEKRLGQGGMATIFLGVQPSTGRRVAIKTLPKAQLNDAKAVARFEREAKVLAALQHPHILPLIDYGEAGDYKYLVVPFLAHGDLEERLNRTLGPMDQAEARRLLVQLGEALDHAHSQGIVHRDLKPGNVLLDAQGNAMLADFGIAHQAGSERLTGVGFTVGTPEYMAPEQVNGQPEARSDLYALGVLAFRLLTGSLPYRGNNSTATLILQRDAPVPDPLTFNPNLSTTAASFLIKALAKDVRDRFQTGAQLATAARAALPEFSSAASQSTQQVVRPPIAPAAIPADSGTQPLSTPARQSEAGAAGNQTPNPAGDPFATTVSGTQLPKLPATDPNATAIGGAILPLLATPLPQPAPGAARPAPQTALPAAEVAALAANLLGNKAAPVTPAAAITAKPSVPPTASRKPVLFASAAAALGALGVLSWWLLQPTEAPRVIVPPTVAAAAPAPAAPAPSPPMSTEAASGAGLPPAPTDATAPLPELFDDFSESLSSQRWDVIGKLKPRLADGVLELTASGPGQWLDASIDKRLQAVAIRLFMPAPISSAEGTAGLTVRLGEDWWLSCYLYARRDRGEVQPVCMETGGKIVLTAPPLQVGWHELLMRVDRDTSAVTLLVNGETVGEIQTSLDRKDARPLSFSLNVWTPKGEVPVSARFDGVWYELGR